MNKILDFIFPRRCPVCVNVVAFGELICTECSQKINYVTEPVCLKCGKPLDHEEQELCYDCQRKNKSFIRNYSVFLYDEVTKPSMSALKYQNKREYADYYTEEFIKQYGRTLCNIGLDGVIAVPIHKSKRAQRGYNQAQLLAVQIAKHLQLPYYSGYLVRSLNTSPQKQLDNIARVRNLNQAFEMGKDCCELNRILLVDDIYTTGATMEACTKVLLNSGKVKKVYGASICIGNGW